MSGKTWVTGPDVDLTLFGDSARDGVRLNGIIDTGASCICVDSRVVKNLGLVASDKKPVQMADGRVEISTVYTARMSIEALGFNDYVQVNAINMERPSLRVLLGRSFLKDYIVNYDGPREQFQFHETNRGLEFYEDHDE